MNEILVSVSISFSYIIYFQHDLKCSGVIDHSQATCITVFTCLNGLLFDIQVLIYI